MTRKPDLSNENGKADMLSKDCGVIGATQRPEQILHRLTSGTRLLPTISAGHDGLLVLDGIHELSQRFIKD